MKVLIYHPSKQHIYKLIEGLVKSNINFTFYTGLYHDCKLPLPLKIISPYLKKARSNKLLPGELVHCITPWNEFLFSLWARTGLFLRMRNKSLFPKQRLFQHKLLLDVDFADISHIITFHTNAFYLYRQLRDRKFQGQMIVEATQPHPYWVMKIYEKYHYYEKYFPLLYTPEMIEAYASEFEYADIVIAPSTFVKKTIAEYGIPENKILTILHGTNFKPIEQLKKHRKDTSNSKLKIAYTGIISYSKGIQFLMKVAENTKAFAEFHLFGNLLRKDILRNAPANVNYHGYVDHKTLVKFYKTIDIFYFPTLYDASGLALLEATGFGLIPIASYNSIGPDIIVNNKTGFLIDPEDTEYVSALLHKLYKDREYFNYIMENINSSKKAPSWQEYQEGYIRLLKDNYSITSN